MAFEVNRRDFMKGAAAVAASVMASGLLTGCSGKTDAENYPTATAGEYTVKYIKMTSKGNDEFGSNGPITVDRTFTPEIRITYSGSTVGATPYSSVFSAKIGDNELKPESGWTSWVNTVPKTSTCKPDFKVTDTAVASLFTSGKEKFRLFVKLGGSTVVFAIDDKGRAVVESVS